MSKLVFLKLITLAIAQPICSSANATKLCDLVCQANDGKEVTDWIAVGTIEHERHDITGPPLNKNVSEFDYRLQKFEKGDLSKLSKLRFKIGWCTNPTELPNELSGLLRIYRVAPSTT